MNSLSSRVDHADADSGWRNCWGDKKFRAPVRWNGNQWNFFSVYSVIGIKVVGLQTASIVFLRYSKSY